MSNTGFRIYPIAGAPEFLHKELLSFFKSISLQNFEEAQDLLCLGDAVGESGERWIYETLLKDNNVFFGKNIVHWSDWITELARGEAILEGCNLKVFTVPRKREFLRVILKNLEENHLLSEIKNLWKEDDFFDALLIQVDELRLSGLTSISEIDRAEELLAGKEKNKNFENLFTILRTYEVALGSREDRYHDVASQIETAISLKQKVPARIFCFGFTKISNLEADLLQELAKYAEVILPISATTEEVLNIKRGEAIVDRSSTIALKRLLTTFSGNIQIEKISTSSKIQKYAPTIKAQTPQEEARAAALTIRVLLEKNEFQNANVIVPRKYFESATTKFVFLQALGVENICGISGSSILDIPFIRSFFLVLQLAERNFDSIAVEEFAHFLAFSTNNTDFLKIGQIASKFGIRKGLHVWQQHAHKNAILESFVSHLENFSKLFPEESTAKQYNDMLVLFAEKLNLASYAVCVDEKNEQIAQTALGTILRNSLLLSSNTSLKLTYSAWLKELKLLITSKPTDSSDAIHKKINIYNYEQFIPPSQELKTINIILGLTTAADPRSIFSFFLTELHRKILSDWNLFTRQQIQKDYIFWFSEQLNFSHVYLSFSKYSDQGKEQLNSFITDIFSNSEFTWPNTSFYLLGSNEDTRSIYNPNLEFKITPPKIKSYSATLLGDYKKCGFKALVERIWKMEDNILEPKLDISALDQGRVLHRAIELYFVEKNGRNLFEEIEIREAIKESLTKALTEKPVEFYAGGEILFEVLKNKILKTLVKFLLAEAKYFEQFPQLGVPHCEVKFSGLIANEFPFEGRIDRIDIDESGKKFLVVDYKSGKSLPSSSEVANGKNFQLQFYIDEAEKITKLEAVGAYFAGILDGNKKNGILRKRFNLSKKSAEPAYFELNGRTGALLEDEDFYRIRNDFKNDIESISREIAAGKFFIKPDDQKTCDHCLVRHACRIRGEILIEKNKDFGCVDEIFSAYLNWKSVKAIVADTKVKDFSEEQKKVLEANRGFVFVEASAGAGKTTVLVERYSIALEKIVIDEKIIVEQALERILAISFTEKSTQELKARIAKKIMKQHGAEVAAQSGFGISTIHGFCKKVLTDFPVEAGVSPLFTILVESDAYDLQSAAIEEIFTSPREDLKEAFSALYDLFDRKDIERMLLNLVARRSLIEADISLFENDKSISKFQANEQILIKYLFYLFNIFCESYDLLKSRKNALDFSDLERLAHKVLQLSEVQSYYKKQYSLIMVDEFQDTNLIQREIIDCIAQNDWQNVFIVGDAKQSIYSFRAADVSVFQRLKKEAMKAGMAFSLNKNFRSQKNIVQFNNELYKKMLPLEGDTVPEYEATYAEAYDVLPAGKKVKILTYKMTEDKWNAENKRFAEGKKLTDVIKKIHSDGRKLDDIAVLFRKISSNDPYFMAFDEANIPYVISGGSGFYKNTAIIDGITFLRALINPNNNLSALALLRSPWVRMSDQDISTLIAEPGSILQKLLALEKFKWIDKIFESFNYSGLTEILEKIYSYYPFLESEKNRLQIQKFLSKISEFEKIGLTNFEIVKKITILSGWEREDDAEIESMVAESNASGAVKILTVHAAKGLEFPVVILVDLDAAIPGSWPDFLYTPTKHIAFKIKDEHGDRSLLYNEALESVAERQSAESKRLFYVASTRAQCELYLLLGTRSSRIKDKTWGDWLRELEPSIHFEKNPMEEFLESESIETPLVDELVKESFFETNLKASEKIKFPLEISVSELSSFAYCAEFHRLKFVQRWDDKVVDLWPKTKSFKKFKNLEQTPADLLLKKLKIEKKERGIALHRILERMNYEAASESSWRDWLKEAYLVQGAEVHADDLEALIKYDIIVLNDFFESPAGVRIFKNFTKAYAEIPFRWLCDGLQIIGTIDRVVEKENNEWILVDYKSSSNESLAGRYKQQLSVYMLALEEALKQRSSNYKIEGLIIDLFSGKNVSMNIDSINKKNLLAGISGVRSNYSMTEAKAKLTERGILGGEHCFSCPYSSHCDAGKKIMLQS